MSDNVVSFPGARAEKGPRHQIRYFGASFNAEDYFILAETTEGRNLTFQFHSLSELDCAMHLLKANTFIYWDEDQDRLCAYERRESFDWPD